MSARTLNRHAIRWKLYQGFTLVLLISLLVGVVGYLGSSRLAANFSALENVSLQSTAIVELDRAVVELRNDVQAYIFTGHEGVAARARATIREVESRLEIVITQTRGSDALALLERMHGHLNTYRETFEQARTERALGKQLLDEEIEQLQPRVNEAVQAAFAEHSISGDDRQRIYQGFLYAQRNLYAYLAKPEYSLLELGLVRLDEAQELLRKHGATTTAELVDQYRTAFERLVQATRAYLYLTSVVMPAESQEFVYVSEQLRELALQRMEPVRQDVVRVAALAQHGTVIGTAMALVLGLLLASRTARRISQPISDITATFSLLAAGSRQQQIPHTERRDEIGQLAAAASIFQLKNEETRALLEKAQQLTADLTEKEHDLTNTNEQLEEFVYTVSHDLRSPIVTSTNYIGMMRRLADQGQPEKALAKLDVLDRSIRSMKQLVEDLLDLSRVGRTETALARLDMNHLLEGIRNELAPELEAQNVSLHIDEDLPELFASETRVRQAFANLIGNAMKYGRNEQGCRIEISAQILDHGTMYRVRDYGPGIAPEFHERVFELFQRLNQQRQGTGVGLSIVDKVMKLHNGSVTIESQGTGDGATFCLLFPAIP